MTTEGSALTQEATPGHCSRPPRARRGPDGQRSPLRRAAARVAGGAPRATPGEPGSDLLSAMPVGRSQSVAPCSSPSECAQPRVNSDLHVEQCTRQCARQCPGSGHRNGMSRVIGMVLCTRQCRVDRCRAPRIRTCNLLIRRRIPAVRVCPRGPGQSDPERRQRPLPPQLDGPVRARPAESVTRRVT